MSRKFERTDRRRRPRTVLTETLVIVGGLVCVLPLLIALLTSFKPESEIIQFRSILPQDWTIDNYRQVLTAPEETPIVRWLMNSLFIASSATLLVLTVTSMAAYAIARLRPPGSRVMLYVMIATLMIPAQVFLIPVYLILEFMHLIDTPWALILPAGSSVFGVFLLHQFFLGIPVDLEEAAEIDGCSPLRIYWHLLLPLSRPALATLGIFVFVGSWNDFLGPLVFLESTRNLTLPVGIALYQTSYFAEYGLTLAASMLATLPAVVIFLVFQKRIIEGVSLTGLK